jgi:general secretion pathway protein A
MYTAFYGLREKPFALSPDPRYLYLAGSHREAFAHLLYGIEQGDGFILVTGEVGTGKTTLCRTLLERLEGGTELAFLFNPSRTALELLQSICAEFGIKAEGRGRRSLLAKLNDFLIEQKRLGRRVLLIIDEAQTLSENTLEQVRLLSNLETSSEKLIQILLLGQPELDQKLDSEGLRQLRQRISVRWQLSPLSAEETHAYIRHRVGIAANKPTELFSESALRQVHRRTGGIPRLINQLCDRALLAGYAAGQPRIDSALIRTAAQEIPDTRRGGDHQAEHGGGRFSRRMRATLLAAVVIAISIGIFVGQSGRTGAIGSFFRGPGVIESGFDPATVEGHTPPDTLEAAAAEEEGATLRAFNNTPPEITPLAPGLFFRLLQHRDVQVAIAESHHAILEGTGRRVPALGSVPKKIAALQSGIEERGLVATLFDGGSLDLLRRLDHPVVLAFTPDASAVPSSPDLVSDPSESKSLWLALLGFDGDRGHLAGLISGQVVSVPVRELTAHWLETGLIVWERHEPVPERLIAGEKGGGVYWLQRSLAELQYFSKQANGQFGDDTKEALRRFQERTGLVADGIAGPLTQIALYGQLGRYEVPRLSTFLDSFSSPVPPPGPGDRR